MTNTVFALVASGFSVIAFIPYIWETIKGKTRPEGASWWTWAIITCVTTLSSWFAGASLSVLLLPIWLCFSQFIIAILSIKYGSSNWDWINKFCVAGALLGIFLWILTGQALLALVISITADFLASVPNIRHLFKKSEEESRASWTLGWVSSVLQMFSIKQWSLAESGWALYFLINMSINVVLVWRITVINSLKKIFIKKDDTRIS